MSIQKVGLVNYRNISEAKLDFCPHLNILIGRNGQGKTNLLESIYLLSCGKSFRTSEKEALIGLNSMPSSLVSGEITCGNLNHSVSVKISHQQKTMFLNGKKTTGNQLRKLFPIVLFSPESLSVIKSSSSQRRKLVDDLGISVFPHYPQVFTDYERLLKQKNALLKQNKEENGTNRENNKVIHNLTDLFFAKSARLISQRLEILEKVKPYLKEAFSDIMDDALVEIDLDYRISGESALNWPEEKIVNAMYKRWEELEQKEKASGASLVGPHKNDVVFSINGFEARKYCSQGQQRAAILAFKLAHIGLHCAIHGSYPILLLDDVLSELDGNKQRRFLKKLTGTDSQIFLTTTDAVSLPSLGENRIFEVQGGRFFQDVGARQGRQDWHRVMS